MIIPGLSCRFTSIMSKMEGLNRKKENVILVDKKDNEIGIGEKIKIHQEGKLHRAFSIFIFNSKSELLLQKRSNTKYHSGGQWTNTCCGHPRPVEPIEKAAHRRINEEMGFDCELKEIFSFIYQVKFDNTLFEHEYDHVIMGRFDGKLIPNRDEVSDWKWIDIERLKKDIQENPDWYTPWLKISIDRIVSYLR